MKYHFLKVTTKRKILNKVNLHRKEIVRSRANGPKTMLGILNLKLYLSNMRLKSNMSELIETNE